MHNDVYRDKEQKICQSWGRRTYTQKQAWCGIPWDVLGP